MFFFAFRFLVREFPTWVRVCGNSHLLLLLYLRFKISLKLYLRISLSLPPSPYPSHYLFLLPFLLLFLYSFPLPFLSSFLLLYLSFFLSVICSLFILTSSSTTSPLSPHPSLPLPTASQESIKRGKGQRNKHEAQVGIGSRQVGNRTQP